ncbi:MAG: FAD binding domain-containing protein [Planctomycetota bacterium]
MTKPTLCFVLNGRPIELTGRDALLPLTVLLRERLGLTGTKVVCAEGDCGACTVLLGRPQSGTGGEAGLDYRPIDACIYFAFQCHGAHVVTVEGLDVQQQGETKALTVIQESLVAGHGSQCGFCTPGIVMALHGEVERGTVEHPLEEDNVRCALSGNLCRCTGYQQIMDACSAVPHETIRRLSEVYDEQAIFRLLQQASHAASLTIAVPHTEEALHDAVSQNGVLPHWAEDQALPTRDVCVHIPQTIDEALAVREQQPGCLVIAGATDVGVWHNHGTPWPDHVLSLSLVQAITECVEVDGGLSLGASATWDQVIRCIQDHYPAFVDILERFGSPQIREAGTIGGNIANGSPIADSLPFLFVVDAMIEAGSHQRGRRQIPITAFYMDYKKNVLEPDELLLSIKLPTPAQDERLFLEKVSKRRDMDISTFTAGVKLKLSDDLFTIEDAAVAFGGVGPVVRRLSEVETALVGKPMTEATFFDAGRIAREAIRPITDVRGHSDFRRQLAENILLKAYYSFATPEVVP